eukprot:1158407-Pelagomonas_calceolata.AAC.2
MGQNRQYQPPATRLCLGQEACGTLCKEACACVCFLERSDSGWHSISKVCLPTHMHLMFKLAANLGPKSEEPKRMSVLVHKGKFIWTIEVARNKSNCMLVRLCMAY